MTQKAKDDAKERQELAVSRVAERYRQLEEEKASKRIVVVDRIVPTSQKRKTGWGRGSASSAGSASSESEELGQSLNRSRQSQLGFHGHSQGESGLSTRKSGSDPCFWQVHPSASAQAAIRSRRSLQESLPRT